MQYFAERRRALRCGEESAVRWLDWRKSRFRKAASPLAGSPCRADKPRTTATAQLKAPGAFSLRHLRNRKRIQPLQKSARLLGIKLSILRFDAEKKPVLRRAIEFGNAKERVVGTGQAIERE